MIKMAPVLYRLKQRKVPHVFIHSNQHYSKEMDGQIARDLKMEKPDFNLNVGSGSHAVQTGKIMEGVEKVCLKVKPEILIVHGDTNTTLGGALTAKKLHIKVAHVEAGLRSFDRRMPEEINRILTDRISDILFAPTEESKRNLQREGIDDKSIVVTGNTVADALKQHLPLTQKSKILESLRVEKENYILVTAHRAENVDEKGRLTSLLGLLSYASKLLGKKLVWPMHPRTSKKIGEYGLSLSPELIVIPPIGYIDMLCLLQNSAMVLTDSGGIQEEAYVLEKPLITLRDSTERPETLSANFIVDLDRKKFAQAVHSYQAKSVSWNKQAFGNGRASSIIVRTLERILEENRHPKTLL